MTNYYRVDVSALAVLDGPGVLPDYLRGLAASDLADLSWCDGRPDLHGIGYWPAVQATPDYDPATQRLSEQLDATPDPEARTVIVQPLVVNLTPAEVEARNAAVGATLKQQVADAVQHHLDAAVASRNYASAAAAVSYVGDPNPRWDAEGRAVLHWRSAVWQTCFAALDDVLAGRRAPLTSKEMIAELPALVWPD